MLRDYQQKIANKASEILKQYGIVYLAMEVRTGKTLTALQTIQNNKYKKILFVTKKNAIEDILTSYEFGGYEFEIKIINYEQLHKETPVYDCYVIDEAHSTGAFPKLSKRTKLLKKLVGDTDIIMLSGTPWTESGSQLYHQLHISNKSPFTESSFYKWAKINVDIKQEMRNGSMVNNYKKAKMDVILPKIEHLLIKFNQMDAGFEHSEVEEHIKLVPINPRISDLVATLIKDGVYTFKDGSVVVCDSAVKKQSKAHQLYSGTVKTDDGKYKILDRAKAEYIKENYKDKKIAIFYKFVAEGIVLSETFKNYTESAKEFNENGNKVYIKQVQSGSMGVNLFSADILIFYNIDFSVMQYIQAKARVQNMNKREKSIVHWIFAEGGIEEKIYNSVINKRDYTLFYFKKDFINGINNSKKYNKVS